MFVLRRFIVDIANQRGIKQRFRFRPELVTGFPVTLGIGNQSSDELQDILFAVDIGKGVIMLRLAEIDRVEHADFIRLIDDLPVFVLNRISLRVELGCAAL